MGVLGAPVCSVKWSSLSVKQQCTYVGCQWDGLRHGCHVCVVCMREHFCEYHLCVFVCAHACSCVFVFVP